VGAYAVSPEQQVRIVADDTFCQWSDLCIESWKSLGFDSEAQAKEAYLGDIVWPVYRLNTQSFSSTELLSDQLAKSTLFLIPVMADENIITDLVVMLVNGDWKVVGIGGHVCKKASALLEANGLAENEMSIVYSPWHKFFISKKDGEEIGLPYAKDNDSMKMTSSSVEKLKEQIIQENKIDAAPNNSLEQTKMGNAAFELPSPEQSTSISFRLSRFINYYLNA